MLEVVFFILLKENFFTGLFWAGVWLRSASDVQSNILKEDDVLENPLLYFMIFVLSSCLILPAVNFIGPFLGIIFFMLSKFEDICGT